MSDYREIAERIVKIIISPDTVVGFMDGVMSVPLDLGYMVYGYFDTESHYAYDRGRMRIAQAIRKGILSHDRIAHSIQIIFNEFDKQVTESDQNKIYSRVISSIVGRTVTNGFLASKITERSIRASEKLSIEEPEAYQLLRPMDYDLLYFLLEPALKPFIDALSVKRHQGTYAFNKILMLVEEELSRYYG